MIVPVNAGIGAYHFLVASILLNYTISYETGLFFATLIHGSDANRSTFRRAGIVFRYMNSDSIFDRKHENHHQKDGHEVNYSKRPIWLIKGHSGKNTLIKNIN